jgi:hypothetical protein
MRPEARLAQALLGPPGSALRRWRVALAALLGALLAVLAAMPEPWTLPGAPSPFPRPGQGWRETARAGIYWSTALNAALALLLFATARLWAREIGARPEAGRPLPSRSCALLLLAAVALAGALRWPLVRSSVWMDEVWTLSRTIVGRAAPDGAAPDGIRFRPATWEATFFEYRRPTNHAAYSVAARSSLAAWRALTGAPRRAFDELALRFPALLAALASVLAVGLLVHELGFPRAAPAAAFLLALHPWHIRHGSEARGYAFVVLFTLLGALALLRALRGGRWRAWLAYGASIALLLWSFPLAAYVPLALGAGAALAIAAGASPGLARRDAFARLVVASVVAAMALVQLMGPNAPQALATAWVFEKLPYAVADPVSSLWGFLATGIRTRAASGRPTGHATLEGLAEEAPGVAFVVWVALPLLAALGLVRAFRRGGAPERAAVVGLAVAAPLLLLHQARGGVAFSDRYAFFAIAAVVPAFAIGIEGTLLALLRAPGARRVGVPLGLALGLAAYQGLVWPRTRELLRYPHVASREVLEWTARAGGPNGLRASVGVGASVPRVYDPGLEVVDQVEDLEALCARARAEGRPLHLFYAYSSLNRHDRPEVFALLDERRLFEEVAELGGIDHGTVTYVLRYTGAPLEGAR